MKNAANWPVCRIDPATGCGAGPPLRAVFDGFGTALRFGTIDCAFAFLDFAPHEQVKAPGQPVAERPQSLADPFATGPSHLSPGSGKLGCGLRPRLGPPVPRRSGGAPGIDATGPAPAFIRPERRLDSREMDGRLAVKSAVRGGIRAGSEPRDG